MPNTAVNAAVSTTPAVTGDATTPATAGVQSNAAPATGATTDKAAPPQSLLSGSAPKDEQGQLAGENKTTPAAGAELEVTVPEGFEVDPKALDAFKTIAKDSGLKSESANKLIALYAEQARAAAESQVAAFRKQSDAWETDLIADKEFGGQNLAASKANLDRARAMSPEAKTLMMSLDEYGLGNLPSAVKFFAKFGSMLSEDTTSGPSARGAQPPQNESPLERLGRLLQT